MANGESVIFVRFDEEATALLTEIRDLLKTMQPPQQFAKMDAEMTPEEAERIRAAMSAQDPGNPYLWRS